ncbi:MAG: transcription-repair coupling factor [Myxococcales bacterium]|nr:transcription-repair coupling factor [Myxococcales bacterium]
MLDDLSPLSGGLQRATATTEAAVRALAGTARVDLAGLPPGAAALLLVRASRAHAGPMLVVTPDQDAMRRTAESLRFFLGETEGERTQVLHFPAADTSPFLDVASDRRATMDRLAALFHMAQGLPWRFLVVSAAALIRKVAPREAITSRSKCVRAEDELDRDELVRVLADGGYLRVPVAEDPGTFAVRGGILDVYAPHAPYPARIDLDDWLVTSIKYFDPDTQRTVSETDSIFVHPVRETLLGEAEVALARQRIRTLCDDVNWPTKKTLALLDDISAGRMFYGLDGLLPAFYPALQTLFEYMPSDARVVYLDPVACHRTIRDEREQARNDHGAKVSEGAPTYALRDHYLDEAELARRLEARPVAAIHRMVFTGAPSEDASPLAVYEHCREESVLHLGATDHSALVGELKAARGGSGREEGLAPGARNAQRWLDAGMRVLFVARNHTQGERLRSLLSQYQVPTTGKPEPFAPSMIEGRPPGAAQVSVGALADGFVMPTEGLVCITEGEIFGTQTRKRAPKKQKARDTEAFLEDLRQLEIGDFVVHADHGVGRYLGLERKSLGQSQFERYVGDEERYVEVLVVEYKGGDRLLVPVTRLNLLQKFAAGDAHTPKVDRLGGSTFSKTKGKVEKAVRQLAEDLLKLYAERAAAEREAVPAPDRSYAEFEATFPYEETRDQLAAIDDVMADLDRPTPMDRLVCGDVGFGKTEVALRAAFRVAMAGRQVAVLCPTTVLAQQHYNNFVARMSDYPLRVGVLSRFVDKAEQSEVLAGLKEGKVDVVIGTHRLLSKDVHFKQLGLLVVDEEQRFGVSHKERIKNLRKSVDVLTLSATPIPRTLQMAIGGMRDLSLITSAPVDRRAVRTFACRWEDHTIREAILREMNRGGQAFFVYNRIDGLYERADRLQKLLPDVRIAVAHGQMGEVALEQTMTDFIDGRYDVLCSTAIIESGIDIPRANTMIIDRADTFGLSQLYQLRGRVGRSRERAYCYLLTPPPSTLSDEARSRIEALERFTELGSGFKVASLDMELRGAGDLLGAEQSGSVSLVGFDMFVHMLEQAVAELRGEEVVADFDTEMTLAMEHYLPDDYIDDVGLRLSLYKRLASARDEERVHELAVEMEDRFGPPPPPAQALLRVMALRPLLREYRILGCEADERRVALHLRADTPLDPAKVMALVGLPRSPWKLTPDMKLTHHRQPADEQNRLDGVDHVREVLRVLPSLCKDS